MRRAEVLRILHAHFRELQALGVRSLSLFGSTARDEARLDSDVDLLVEFDDRPMGLFGFLEVKERLELLLGRAVDLVMRDSIKRQLRDRILADEVRAE